MIVVIITTGRVHFLAGVTGRPGRFQSVVPNYWWTLWHSCKESCKDAENVENLKNNENHLGNSILIPIILRGNML